MFYLLHGFSRRPPGTQQERLEAVCDHQPLGQTQVSWAEPAGLLAGSKVRGAEYLGRERAVQRELWEGELFHLEGLSSPFCFHCNITYKTRAQSLMSLTLKMTESLSCLRVLVMCSECAVLFPKAFHLKASFRQPA